MRKETLEQLDVFRKQQEEAERRALEEENNGPPAAENAQWIASGRKRKKGHEGGLLKGVRLKKPASGPEEKSEATWNVETDETDSKDKLPATAGTKGSSGVTKTAAPTIAKAPPPAANSFSLSLGYGSSDEDD